MSRVKLTFSEWKAKASELFGNDHKLWRFKCSQCNQVQSLQEFIDAGVEEPENKFFFSCIGRWVESHGCNWTLGGLLQIHTTEVLSEDGRIVPVFEFDEPVIHEELIIKS